MTTHEVHSHSPQRLSIQSRHNPQLLCEGHSGEFTGSLPKVGPSGSQRTSTSCQNRGLLCTTLRKIRTSLSTSPSERTPTSTGPGTQSPQEGQCTGRGKMEDQRRSQYCQCSHKVISKVQDPWPKRGTDQSEPMLAGNLRQDPGATSGTSH